MQQVAAWLGTLIGYSVGYVLKIAGPELRAFLAGAIRDALNDSAEMGGKNAALDSAWDANGLRGGNPPRDSHTGTDGGEPRKE